MDYLIPKSFVIPHQTLTLIDQTNQTIPRTAAVTIAKKYHQLKTDFVQIQFNSLSISPIISCIKGEANLLDSILKLWTKTKQSNPNLIDNIKVTAMIQAKTSGWALSQDIFNQNPRRRCLILAGFGTVLPELDQLDKYWFDYQSQQIILKEIQLKNFNYQLKLDKIQKHPLSKSQKTQACLSDQQIKNLAEIVLQLKRKKLNQIIVNWAIDKNQKLYLITQDDLSDQHPIIQGLTKTKISIKKTTLYNHKLTLLSEFNNQNQTFTSPVSIYHYFNTDNGAIDLITQPNLIKNQLQKLNRHHLLKPSLKLIIPSVRGIEELMICQKIILDQIAELKPQIIMELSLAENIFNINDYLNSSISGFSFNVLALINNFKNLTSLKNNKNLYPFDWQLSKIIIYKILTALKMAKKNSYLLQLQLHQPNLDLIKLALTHNFDSLVVPKKYLIIAAKLIEQIT